MTLPTMYSEPWAAGPDDPFRIEPCPECGAPDAEFGLHEPGCPSGFATRDLTPAERELDALQNAYRDFEDEHPMAGQF
jgi:hypothetical protein